MHVSYELNVQFMMLISTLHRFALKESEEGVVSPPTEDNSGSFFSLENSPQLGGTEEVSTANEMREKEGITLR